MNLQVNLVPPYTALMLKTLLANDDTVLVCGQHKELFAEEYPKEAHRFFNMQQLNDGSIKPYKIILYDIIALQIIQDTVEGLEDKNKALNAEIKENPLAARLDKAERTNNAYYRILCGDLKSHLDGVKSGRLVLNSKFIDDTYDRLKKAKSKIRRSK